MSNTNYFHLFIRSKKRYKAEIADLKQVIRVYAEEREILCHENSELLCRIESSNEIIDRQNKNFNKLLSILEVMSVQNEKLYNKTIEK